MATTNFANLSPNEKTAWEKDVLRVAHETSYLQRFVGDGANAMISRVKELRQDAKGARAILTLVPDLTNDGVAGDNIISGNEASSEVFDQTIVIDQLRNAVKSTGKMAEQKSVIEFRKTVRDQLGIWLANRKDQMGFLALSSVPFSLTNNGAPRVADASNQLASLDFAVPNGSTPSSKRVVRLVTSGGNKVIQDGAGSAATDSTLRPMTYADVVNLKAIAKDRYIKPVYGPNGDEVFHLFLHPMAMAQLRLDADFIANVRHAGVRGDKNQLFVGANDVMVDGVIIHEHRYVFNTSQANAGSRFGASGNDHGQRALLCGAQALGWAEIGGANWEEGDVTDYGNQQGIAVGQIFGMLKPRFKGNPKDYSTAQDFGVLCVDTGATFM